MTTRLQSVLLKTKQRGFKWLIQRIVQETWFPSSFIGRMLKPFHKLIYYFVNKPLNKKLTRKTISKSIMSKEMTLVYDLQVSPITFDFVSALAIAEFQRKKNNLENLRVIIVPGNVEGLRYEEENYKEVYDTFAIKWRLNQIILPIVNCLPSCSSINICGSREEAAGILEYKSKNIYPTTYTVFFPIQHKTLDMLECDKDIMCLQAPKQSLRYVKSWLAARAQSRKVITITLRQSPFMLDRNSKIQEWLKFAKSLDKKKYYVVFVPDTDYSVKDDPAKFKDFGYYPEVAWNVLLRMALYQLAYLNLGINNGSMGLCWFCKDCRYLTFKMVTESVPQTTEKTLRHYGFEPNKSLPFATKYQKWIWQDDNFDIIQYEFNKMCSHIENNVRNFEI